MRYEAQTPGKWILTGEHSVLRGVPAIVFPLQSRSIHFLYETSLSELQVEFGEDLSAELNLIFWGVLEKACVLFEIKRMDIKGKLKVASSLPIGAGLGASASLCVAVTNWLSEILSLSPSHERKYEIAKNLENLFHGESSGVDVAIVMSKKPLHFERKGVRYDILPKWSPKLILTYSGQRGMTKECVSRVKKIIESRPSFGETIDQLMMESSRLAEEALQLDESDGVEKLVKSIDNANLCFQKWGLINSSMTAKQEQLLRLGALAVKPTGSGDGGFILSLWKELPDKNQLDYIPCFS